MKKLFITLTLALLTIAGRAWTITNLPYSPGVSYAWTNIAPIINNNNNNFVGWLNQITSSNALYTTQLAGLLAGGGGGSTNGAGITNLVVSATSLAYTSAPTAVVTGVTNNIGYVVFGIPAAAPSTNTFNSTNTITAYNFTNQMLQSRQITLYQTNYAYWNASNYLGRVAGIVSWIVASGDDGGANPSTAPVTFPMTLYGTYATNYTGWFVLTNGFVTQSNISLYVTLGTNSWGTTLANPGSASIFSVDHWELYGRTNFLDYQFAGSKVPPTWGWQYVSADYVNGLFGSAFNNNFSTSKDTNNVTHFAYSSQNRVMFDLTSSTKGVPAISLTPGGYATYTDPSTGNTYSYPTNVVMTIATTNLSSSYTLLAQTNLLNVFFATTNFVASTSGTNTLLTIPVIPGPGQWFFYVVNGFNFGAKFSDVVSMPYVLFGTNANYTSMTIAHSTNSTFGYGAGLLACDTNYAYISVGTNSWRRIAISTNSW
jgi:hypothetical protein